ncbi:MAG: hypothetical protein ACPGCL_04480, partial [Paracoccaceae bacterium]
MAPDDAAALARSAAETKNIKLWNCQMLRLIDQRGPMADMVSVAHDVTAALRCKTVMKTVR